MAPVSILVVEDEVLIRLDIANYLSEMGFVVHEAANADQAIAILESDTPIQIMFTDIDMPGSMNGLKLSHAVHKRWPPIKIILTSGHRKVEDADLPDGSSFFPKPYMNDAVASAVLRMSEGGHPG